MRADQDETRAAQADLELAMAKAKSVERINFLGRVIRDDRAAGFDYANDEEFLERMRQAWHERHAAITGKKRRSI